MLKSQSFHTDMYIKLSVCFSVICPVFRYQGMIFFNYFKAPPVTWRFPIWYIINSIWCFSFRKPSQFTSHFILSQWYLIYLLFKLCSSFCLFQEKVWYRFYQLKSKNKRHILTSNSLWWNIYFLTKQTF